uniref:Ankyrin repeat and SOCS box protein 13-like n=1 Tax=Saccoglossus kowalevskii TaxID=10224 RepID=A0ABM0MEY1_SACKO|nr:PREDICTED: ankyrin repeat and SOCS box protein 13-like [Saccoglossus kowalevskii]
MHHAAANGEILGLHKLIEKGDSVNISTIDGVTPLHEACLQGRLNCVRKLVNAGARVNARNIDGATPLCDACVKGNVDVVKFLLQNGADVNPTLLSATPLHEAAMRGKTDLHNWECVQILIEAGASLEAQDCHYGTPLHVACFKQSTECVNVLLKAGAVVNARKILETPLHVAAKYSHIEIIKVLVDFGADLYIRDNQDNRPVHYAKYQAKELLQFHESNAWPLLHLCRCTIRSNVGISRLKFIKNLKLPELLLGYLLFE